MGALNCSCVGISKEKLNEFTFDNEVLLRELRNKFDESISNIETITEEEFNQELNSFPNAKELLNEYEPKINSQTQIDESGTNKSVNNDKKEGDLIQLPKPIKLKYKENNLVDLFKGWINRNNDLTGLCYQITNDYLYYGNFENNQLNGKGIMITKEGYSLFGDWVEGYCTGKGHLKMNNIMEYEGDYVRNKKQGYGIEKYPDGSWYEGEFQDDKKNGKGKCKMSGDETYEGEFKDNLFNGEGIYKWPSESREYRGHFKNGVMDGKGISIFHDGSKYDGNYKNGLKHGLGKYIWPNGKVFYGNWVNNKMHGDGLIENDNEKYDVIYRFGKNISTRKADDMEENKQIKFSYNDILNKENISNVESFICPICNNILCRPNKCCKCLKNYCLDCIKEGIENKKCPSCGGTEYELNVELLSELISKINVNCNICQKQLDYKSSLSHNHS